MRTYDIHVVTKATNQYAEDIKGFDPPFWLDDQRNIALTNQNHDVALFEYFKPGTVLGHYFFHSRGKSAIEAAHLFLDELFSEYAVDTVVGMTPLDNKGARWMNRRLGFTYCGIVKTEVDPCEIVMMTKKDWLASRKGDQE